MAKQADKLIQETKQAMSFLEKELLSAMQVREQYQKEINNARARIKRKEQSRYPDTLYANFVKSVFKGNVLMAALIIEIDNAVQKNVEFTDEAYLKALYSVANDKSIYKFFKRGSGWNTTLDLQIVFEEEAGLLPDWSRGIIEYRKELKTRGLEDELAGEKASKWWLENVYNSALHTKTIAKRLELSGRKAPFWQILDAGSSPLLSDRPGGVNYVKSSRTGFVEKAEFKIEDEFLSIIRREHSIWYDELEQLNLVLQEYIGKRDEYSEEVKQLRTEIRLNDKVLKSFEEKKNYINRNKLAKAIRQYRAGEEFESAGVDISLSKRHRVTLTIKELEGYI